MSRPPQFFFDFKRTVEATLRGVKRLSLRHFIEEFDYDDFLEGEAQACESPRKLALAFAVRFLDVVPSEYANALSMAIVSFLAESCGRKQLDKSDIDAIKTLVTLPTKNEQQISQWMDAYFRDVS